MLCHVSAHVWLFLDSDAAGICVVSPTMPLALCAISPNETIPLWEHLNTSHNYIQLIIQLFSLRFETTTM